MGAPKKEGATDAHSRQSGKSPAKILILGTLPPPIGGTTVLLKTLVDELSLRDDVEVHVISTGGIRNGAFRGFARLISTLFAFIGGACRAQVISAHLNDAPFAYLGVIITLVGKLLRRPVVMRKFGGNTFNLGKVANQLAYRVMRQASVSLVETHMLEREAQSHGVTKVLWYPNNRTIPAERRDPIEVEKQCRRFIFLGHVKGEKGIRELIEASERLTESVSIDVFGPFTADLTEREFLGKQRIRYCGVVQPEEVGSLLESYDAIVLPTYNAREGYPGVVIEGYIAGLPVICTSWQALPEIVDETSGILIPPRDSEALYQAMKLMNEDPELYRRLCEGAIRKSRDFDSKVWAARFVEICYGLIESDVSQSGCSSSLCNRERLD